MIKKISNKKSVLLLVFILFAQGQVNLDSLWNVWTDKTVNDSSRVQAMKLFIKDGYLYSNPDSAFIYAQILYEFAEDRDLHTEIAWPLRMQGITYFISGDNAKALELYQRCLAVYKNYPDKSELAKTLNNIGVIYDSEGDLPKALNYFQRSLELREELADKDGIVSVLNNIGLVYYLLGNYPRALDNYKRSMRVIEDVQDEGKLAGILNNIGLIYMNLEDYPSALDYYQRSLEITENLSDKGGMATALNNLGNVYKNQGNYSLAMEYLQRSLRIKTEMSNKRGLASTLNNIGSIYMHQNQNQQAMEYYQQSLKIREELSDKRGIAITSKDIGKVLNNLGNHKEAIIWCEKGLEISEEIKVIEEQKNSCLCLYNAYKALGDDSKALEYYEHITMLRDSLLADETSKKLQQLEFSRQMFADSLLREEEKLIVQIAHEKEVRKKNRTKNTFIAIALFLLASAVVIHRRMLFMKRVKHAIEHEKDRSDKLLLNILPWEIAEELKENGRAAARTYNTVSILFTDFKDFTYLSEKLSAEELVGEINVCFEAFDAICERYEIEKIKTNGDSYMSAGGLPVPKIESVRNTVLAGIEMTEFMISRKNEQKARDKISFEMRVGIHTGSVVAGIVGVKKFHYDIWGDTVNTASRMENSGEEGKVNISWSTYDLIKDDPQFKFESRGGIKTKGKGIIEMWFVERV